jgi:hypothetical protein
LDNAPQIDFAALIRRSSRDPLQIVARVEFLKFAAMAFKDCGEKLHVLGHIVGGDRKEGLSPFGHGDDETVAISLILRIASEIVSTATELFLVKRTYAAAALLRQLVEVEYLAWAFETRDADAARWIRSTKKDRQNFFSPRKLREAANGKFRAKDYSYHCEMGGHPTPFASRLLTNDNEIIQLLLSDMVTHTRNIWVHLGTWAVGTEAASIFHNHNDELFMRWTDWNKTDELSTMPQP